MRPARMKGQSIRVGFLLAIVFFLTGAFAWKTVGDNDKERALAQDQASAVLVDLAQFVKSKINRVELVSSGFAGAIGLEPEITQSRFSDYAATVALSEAGIVNVAGIRDFRIELVYPFQENAAVIGRSLVDAPEQLQIAERARDHGESILQGPVRLLQGIDGFILRDPVFLQRGEVREFWGFISIVFAADSFFSDQSVTDMLAGYDIAIRDAGSGRMVLGEEQLFAQDALRRNVSVPGGHWEMAIQPVGGWVMPTTSWQYLLVYLLSMFASLAITNYMFAQRQKVLDAADQLQAAIEVLADGFVLYDSEDRLVICNSRYLEIYADSAPAIKPGARFEDILRYGLEHGQYPSAAGREEEWLEERLKAHRGTDYMLEQDLKEGRWLRIREMETPDGGRVGIRVDITELVQSRERAEVAEGRLRDAINTVPAGFWLFDADGRLEIVNDRAVEHMQAIQGARHADNPILVGDHLKDVVRKIAGAMLKDATPETIEAETDRYLRMMGSVSPQFETQLDENTWFKYFGQRTDEGGLVGFAIDISETKRHELGLKETNARLRSALRERDAAEARFADVADISTEWFWEQDAQNRLIYLSPGFERATGIPAATVLGHERKDVMLEEGEAEGDGSGTLIDRIEAHEPFQDFIYRSALTGGVDVWVRTSGRPIFDDTGAFAGYIGVAADVTPLYAALQAARRADEAKTQFLNVISHELRTPMTIVLGFNAFLRNIDSLPEFRQLGQSVAKMGDSALAGDYEASVAQVKRFAGKIQVSGEQLQMLIQDMLDLARIEANTLRIDLARVNARKVVETVVDQFQPLAAEKSISFDVDVPDLDVRADDTRLRQVLINLIANAIKFTDAGQVAIRAGREGENVVFHVEDTGIGIPSENLPHIFDRFSQVDNSATRNQGGAGLGLAISKELIKIQGGRIAVASEMGQGTQITFTLPLWADEPLESGPQAGIVATK